MPISSTHPKLCAGLGVSVRVKPGPDELVLAGANPPEATQEQAVLVRGREGACRYNSTVQRVRHAFLYTLHRVSNVRICYILVYGRDCHTPVYMLHRVSNALAYTIPKCQSWKSYRFDESSCFSRGAVSRHHASLQV